MAASTQQKKIYFLENAHGQAVRAIEWETEELNFIFRHDTRRMESVSDLSPLTAQGVEFTVLETVDKKFFKLKNRYPIRSVTGELSLVSESIDVQPNVELTEDNNDEFLAILKKTSIGAAVIALLLLGVSFFISNATPAKPELQIVEVLDRKDIEKPPVPVVTPMREKPPVVTSKITKTIKPVKTPKKVVKNQFIKTTKKTPRVTQMGALGVLGSLTKSNQKGGLQINDAQTSAGIGRGGSQGSGGIQTSVYSKGMFAAPLGSGNRADGAGGYGTKGKGGGRAGYGKVQLVGTGSSSSFFEPIESEAWTEGGLDRNAIAAVIFRHLSEVRFCYEQGLQRKPNLAGRVSMNFIIGPKGQVTTATVNNSSLGHPPVETCIRDRLKTWKFPQPQGGVNVKVNYPFSLRRVTDS